MLVDLTSHWDNYSLRLIKFVIGSNTDIISADVKKQTSLTSGISSYNQKRKTQLVRDLTNLQKILSQQFYNIKNIQEFSLMQDITWMM